MNRGPQDPYRFEISELDPSIAKFVERTEKFPYNGFDYEYGVLHPDVANVHNAVGMFGGQNLIASSAIPELILPAYLTHEIQCNRERAGEIGRCASVETGLLQEADPEILAFLLSERLKTFEDLVILMKIDVEEPANPFYAEIAGTTKLLRQKVAELGIVS